MPDGGPEQSKGRGGREARCGGSLFSIIISLSLGVSKKSQLRGPRCCNLRHPREWRIPHQSQPNHVQSVMPKSTPAHQDALVACGFHRRRMALVASPSLLVIPLMLAGSRSSGVPSELSESRPKIFNVFLCNDNFNMREYVSRVLMMVCDVSESEATQIMMEANADRWRNRALCGTWEEALAMHVYSGMRAAGLSAAMVQVGVDEDSGDEGDDPPRYLDGTLIDDSDLPRYYQ